MLRDLTLITPTADQPTGVALLEQYMQEQTAIDRVAEWIVADDGGEAAQLTAGQTHLRRCREPECSPERSLCRNLLAAIGSVKTDLVAIIEHDDLYHPRHLELLLEALENPEVCIAGDDEQRYYHIGQRRYLMLDNIGAALCQTGFRRSACEAELLEAIAACEKSNWRGVDANFWGRVPKTAWGVFRGQQVVGIKGLPGRPGIGMGHRPGKEGDWKWEDDREGHVLRCWCGPHAATYLGYYCDQASQASKQELLEVPACNLQ